MRFSVAVLAVHVATFPAHASVFYDGSSLLEHCNSRTAVGGGICFGFIIGAADSFNCKQPILDGFRWHSPKGAKAGQIEKVVVKYLNEHPEKLHLSASSLVAAALSEAFPCP